MTILNRMLSSKMKIKAFYNQQENKLKNKLFQMLKDNSKYMNTQKMEIAKV